MTSTSQFRVQPSSLSERRAAWGAAALAASWPNKSHEEWRHTDLSGFDEFDFRSPPMARAEAAPLSGSWPRITLVNGRACGALPGAGDADGATIVTFADATGVAGELVERWVGTSRVEESSSVAMRNGAEFTVGVLVFVPRGVTVAIPVHVAHELVVGDDPMAVHTRVLVVLEDNAQLTLVETVAGGEGRAECLATHLVEIVAGPGSRCERVRLQDAPSTVSIVDVVATQIERDASVTVRDFEVGGRVGRSELRAVLAGRGSSITATGLGVGTGDRTVDHFVLVDHAVTDGQSRQTFRAVLDDRSTGVFNGKVIVRAGADRSAAEQSDKNLLLSPDANANTRPQLEILADEVKASHGATVGRLDPAALFYLRSRGLPESVARTALTYGFVDQLVADVPVVEIRDRIEWAVRDRLHLETREGPLP